MSDVLTATILSNGTRMSPEYHLMHIDVIHSVNKIPTAKLTVLDGDAARQEFAISNDAFFQPGKEIEIQLRYGDQADQTIFKGIIVRHRVKANKNASFLTIELKNQAFKLTTQRKSAVFQNLKDYEIIKKIIKDNKLKPGNIHSTDSKHTELVQYYCTDWDFILSRAEANGLWVVVTDESISIKKPELNQQLQHKHTFEYGTSIIYDLEIEADIRQQYNSVEGTAWSIQDQQLLNPKQAQNFKLVQGNLDAAKLAKKIGSDSCQLVSSVDLNPQEVTAWANAKMIKSRMSMLKGHIKVPGNATIHPGDIMEIDGIGDRFNGKTYVTGVRHQVSEQGWQTDVQLGLSADWFCQNNDIIDTPAAGLVPAINGLQIGIVEAYEDDPQGQFRVRVKVPALLTSNGRNGIVWARLASIYAGNKTGILFRPEQDDEVILGFLNDDPRQAVILGSVHSKNRIPPFDSQIKQENNIKVIQTRKHQVIFDDGEEEIGIVSDSGNSIVSSNEGIIIEDKNGNKIETNDQGIVIDAGSNKITMKGSELEMP